jgi:hypothetical protein
MEKIGGNSQIKSKKYVERDGYIFGRLGLCWVEIIVIPQ